MEADVACVCSNLVCQAASSSSSSSPLPRRRAAGRRAQAGSFQIRLPSLPFAYRPQWPRLQEAREIAYLTALSLFCGRIINARAGDKRVARVAAEMRRLWRKKLPACANFGVGIRGLAEVGGNAAEVSPILGQFCVRGRATAGVPSGRERPCLRSS